MFGVRVMARPGMALRGHLWRRRRSGYRRFVGKAGPRLVVGTVAATRMAIGVAFALAPRRLTRGAGNDTLMTRSFAVREVVLGVGGLLAAARADSPPSNVRLWAGLGALTECGDLCASLAGVRRGSSSGRVPALVAATGLLSELWAFRASVPA